MITLIFPKKLSEIDILDRRPTSTGGETQKLSVVYEEDMPVSQNHGAGERDMLVKGIEDKPVSQISGVSGDW